MAHPTHNASSPRCAPHPGGRAFLFTVSNSPPPSPRLRRGNQVSSFPRRVVAPGFCFSLPPPDEGRRSAEKAGGGLRDPLARDDATCRGACEAPRAPLRSGTRASRRSTGDFLMRFRASVPWHFLLGIVQRAPRKRVVMPE